MPGRFQEAACTAFSGSEDPSTRDSARGGVSVESSWMSRCREPWRWRRHRSLRVLTRQPAQVRRVRGKAACDRYGRRDRALVAVDVVHVDSGEPQAARALERGETALRAEVARVGEDVLVGAQGVERRGQT